MFQVTSLRRIGVQDVSMHIMSINCGMCAGAGRVVHVASYQELDDIYMCRGLYLRSIDMQDLTNGQNAH